MEITHPANSPHIIAAQIFHRTGDGITFIPRLHIARLVGPSANAHTADDGPLSTDFHISTGLLLPKTPVLELDFCSRDFKPISLVPNSSQRLIASAINLGEVGNETQLTDTMTYGLITIMRYLGKTTLSTRPRARGERNRIARDNHDARAETPRQIIEIRSLPTDAILPDDTLRQQVAHAVAFFVNLAANDEKTRDP